MERLLPTLPGRALHTTLSQITPAQGERRYRVGFFLGCMMSQLFAAESQATLEVLTRFGCEVVTPAAQLCCGSPQDDQGDRQYVRRLARRNIVLFEAIGDVDSIVTDCAACSSMLKEYEAVLRDDPAFTKRAHTFSARVKDIYEWYDQILPPVIGQNHARKRPVTIHDACHLANAQGVRKPQRRVLGRLAAVELVEMKEASACCGSAGIYNITHPDMADKRLARKLETIRASGAVEVVTNGPGCLLQLRAGVRDHNLPVQIRHISQLVDEMTRQRAGPEPDTIESESAGVSAHAPTFP
jgi:glycolate oxidase iron-sulfur subunit